MGQALTIAVACWAAGLASAIGAGFGRLFSIRRSTFAQEVTHGILAFGGGVLLSAVAFALIPEGLTLLPLGIAIPVFFAGSVLVMLADERLDRRDSPRSQMMAMLLDFFPEAVALGAVFPHNPQLGLLLAIFIGAQNLPEGFAAYREMTDAGSRSSRVVVQMALISLLGPAAGLFGFYVLQPAREVVGGMMLLAGGGILYLVFQDVAPQARMERHWTPTLGAALGFIVGMIGERVLA